MVYWFSKKLEGKDSYLILMYRSWFDIYQQYSLKFDIKLIAGPAFKDNILLFIGSASRVLSCPNVYAFYHKCQHFLSQVLFTNLALADNIEKGNRFIFSIRSCGQSRATGVRRRTLPAARPVPRDATTGKLGTH